ncbi:3'-5' exonuclease [Piscinibacter sakaiensis]|uniref:3'-5' exonuclease n=1 Tax=Piscinibacter sakaiensis TaxID=1547922 RepID=UPI003AAEE000
MLHAGLLRQDSNRPNDRGTAPNWPERFAALATSAKDSRLRDYYAAGAPPATTPLNAAPLLAMDIETTGLDPVRDGIVSIGLVPMDLQRIRASLSRQWILKPRVALGAESVTIHGITDSQVQQAPDLNDILGELLEAMAGQVMIVHCRDIERQFLDQALRSRINEGIEFPVIDTMELEARLHRRQRIRLLDRLRGRRPPRVSIRLADSRRRYGLPRYRPHHAPTDALASAELLQAQVAHRFGSDVPLGELWN